MKKKTAISWRYFVGFIIGGWLAVGYCKSTWPLPVLFVLAVIVCASWHSYAKHLNE